VSKITTILKITVAAAGLTATLAHAEPYSLAASCRLTSMIAGEAKCVLSASFVDLGSSVIKRGQIKVDNVLAGNSNNDALNPLIFSMEGEVQATCGVAHTVTGFIMPQGTSTYTQVGSVPAVNCPKAP